MLLLPQKSAVLHWKGAGGHIADTASRLGGSHCVAIGLTCRDSHTSLEMIKNGHHHYQMNPAAGKDAGTSPGAAACSPEKRRRRIRLWCDGWWESYWMTHYVMEMLQLHCLDRFCRARLNECLLARHPPPAQACCRIQGAHRAATRFSREISMHRTFSWIVCCIYISSSEG